MAKRALSGMENVCVVFENSLARPDFRQKLVDLGRRDGSTDVRMLHLSTLLTTCEQAASAV
ncbi:hypothetical protein F444_09272 [Phytophthora nicotianae P1976]|uniref:Uncharacterized protein n=1 Tax=Phytophthora nicotianae P1976 TaxID=1317066 RepID=A0A081A885_PHYNI|nr:hypothetical protein F444_09272 [Phytophthora nicotianae P1976]